MDGLEENLASIGFIWIVLGMTAVAVVSVIAMFFATRRGRQLPTWLTWFALLGSWFLIEVGFANLAAVYNYTTRFVLGGALPSNFSQLWVRLPATLFRSAIFNNWPARIVFGILIAALSMGIFVYFANQLYNIDRLVLTFATANCIWAAAMLIASYGISTVEFSDRELALKFYLGIASYILLLVAQWRIGSRAALNAHNHNSHPNSSQQIITTL